MRDKMLEQITVFIQVVEQGSFTGAADALQIHRPAVSKSVQQLEDHLGVKLLHRTTRKLSITAEGEAFYQRSKHLLAEVNELVANFSPTLPPRGRLRISVPLALVHSLLIPHLSQFHALYPDIELVISSSDKKSDLIAEGFDCVVRFGELPDSRLISKRLGEVCMVTCAAPAYLQQHGYPHTLDDLEQHVAIHFFSAHSREVLDWTFLVEGKAVSCRPASTLLVDNSDVLLSCALAGMGIIQAPWPALAPHIAAGRLQGVLTDTPPIAKPVSLLYPVKPHLPARVRVFIDWFHEIFIRYNV